MSMKIEALSDDLIDDLLSATPVKAKLTTCECGWELDNGYCRNPECEWDAVEDTVFCPHCGNCTDPEHCVWGIQCPICYSPPHAACLDERGGKTGLHQERWDLAGRDWR